MRRFLGKTGLFVGIVLVLMQGFRQLDYHKKMKSSTYLLSIIEKHKRLDSLNSPRIILSGGSNMAFGIDSYQIQEECEIPCCKSCASCRLGIEVYARGIGPGNSKR